MSSISPFRRSILPLGLFVLVLSVASVAAQAAGPTLLADRGVEFGPIASAPTPDGGHLLVWQGRATDFGVPLHGLVIDSRGFPALDLGAFYTLGDSIGILDVAVAPSGRFAAVWDAPDGADQVGIKGGVFEPDGELVEFLSFPEPVEPQFRGWASGFDGRLEALPDGRFVATWTVGWSEDFATDPLSPNMNAPHLMAIGADGELGEPVQLSLGNARFTQNGDVFTSNGSILATWIEDDRAYGRIFELDLTPRTSHLELFSPPYESYDVAMGSAGRFVLARILDGTPSLQRYDFDGTQIGGPVEVPITASQLRLDATSNGRIWLLTGGPQWSFQELDVETFEIIDQAPVASAGQIALSTSGASAFVAWTAAGRESLIMGQVFGASDVALPDQNLALTSPELPGFRVWVRIAGQGLPPIWGTEAPRCLGNALCAAGALPDQAEVIVRVAGPKPNGFLWPTINKLSTSQAEVWIEQIATGESQFYLLPGASPGASVLPGLFDRMGFEPF